MKMKKRFLQFVVCLLLVSLLIPATAAFAEEGIVITCQPQNSVFPENATAYWSVEATGNNLVYDWYIVYQGVAYNTAKSFAENHPWQDGITGDGYGRNETGNSFFINGIGKALDGAEIYCVISDGTRSVTSAKAYISVGGKKSPPEITVPAFVEIKKDKVLKLECRATAANGDSIKSYLWYETPTGELKDIVAIGAKEGNEENNPILVCDTAKAGTRYYVCAVETEQGGFVYSSVIPVTVTEEKQTAENPSDSPVSSDGSDKNNSSSGNENTESPSTDVGTENTGDTEKQPEQPSEKSGIAPLAAVLIAIGGVVVGGGAVALVAVLQKKKQNTDTK